MRNSGAMADRSMDVCIKNIAHGDMAALKELYDELRVPVYQFALSFVFLLALLVSERHLYCLQRIEKVIF